MEKIVILGIGQSFRGDDGIGIVAVNLWAEKYCEVFRSKDIRVETLEMPGLTLLDRMADARQALIVDAVQSGNPVGTLHWVTEKELLSFSPDAQSAHGWGVAETLKLGRKLQREDMPEEITILGVEAAQFEVGGGISSILQDKLPEIRDAIQEFVLKCGK